MAENEGYDQSTLTSSNSAPVESASQTSATPAEKFLPQSHVNDIVGREKSLAHDKGYERGKREAMESLQKSQPSQSTPSAIPSGTAMSEDQYRRIAAEEAQRVQVAKEQEYLQRSNEAQIQQFVQQFDAKLAPGRSKYDDFDAVLGTVEFGNAGHVIVLAQSLDNTADVMYELAKNRPQDLVNIELLAEKHPKQAEAAMRRLSESIKVNQTAANMKRPNEPLSQISPSNTGIDSGSEHSMSVSDFRKIRY